MEKGIEESKHEEWPDTLEWPDAKDTVDEGCKDWPDTL